MMEKEKGGSIGIRKTGLLGNALLKIKFFDCQILTRVHSINIEKARPSRNVALTF